MALSDQQIMDMRADLGIGSAGAVFTDAELDRLYSRAGSDYDKAVVYGIEQIMMDAAKLNDYRAGSSQESKSQVFEHLQAMREVWGRRAGMLYGALQAGVVDLYFQEKGD